MTRTATMELRCSRDLALRLGAVGPQTIAEHRQLRDAGDLLVRDGRTGWALFWPWMLTAADMAAARGFEGLKNRPSSTRKGA